MASQFYLVHHHIKPNMSEEAREAGGKIRDDLHNNSEMAFKVKEIVPLSGPVLVEFIDGILSPKHNPK